MKGDRLLSTKDVAARVMVDVSLVRRWIYRGDFPNAFKVGWAWLIPEADVDDWIWRRDEGILPPGLELLEKQKREEAGA